MKQTTEVRQKQIKQAVLELIATDGIHAISTRNLAKKVGISEGALFRHFDSKRDIMLSIMEDVYKDLLEDLRNIAFSSQPAVSRLFKFLCRHISYLIDNKGITILIFSEAAHMNDPTLKERLHQILIQQKQLISKIIQDGIVEGHWDPELSIEDVAMLYMGIPISLNIELVLNRNNVNTKNFCKNMEYLLNRVLEKK